MMKNGHSWRLRRFRGMSDTQGMIAPIVISAFTPQETKGLTGFT
jgi:hypothetical protein